MPDASAPIRPVVAPPAVLVLGARRFDITHRAVVVGILAPAESGSGGSGRTPSRPLDALIQRAETLVHEGADILEVGCDAIDDATSEREELERVAAAISALRARFDHPLCVTTRSTRVARAGWEAGAVVGNDRTGFADPAYLPAAAALGIAVVATAAPARQPPPGTPTRDDPAIVADIDIDIDAEVLATRRSLAELAARAEAAGIDAGRLLLDPGLAQVSSPVEAARLVQATADLTRLGHPLVVSLSTIALGGGASLGAASVAVGLGARVVRTVDVRRARRVCDTLAAILEAP